MSRIEVGKIELENKPFDLYHLADQIRNLFKKTIEKKGITYIVEMKDVDVRYVVGDEERISQILVNLLSDASKFTEKGEIRMTFRQMMRKKDSVDSCSGSMIPEREWIRSSSSGSSTPSSRRTP